MGLPYVIEYLTTLERPGGGRLVTLGVSQIIVPAFPPNTQIVLQALPFGDDYLDILFLFSLDPAMIPEAFYGWGQHFGSRTYEGILTAWWTTNTLPGYVIITQSEPSIALIENLTVLNQYYAGNIGFIAVATQADLDIVMEALSRMGTSARSEQLAQEAVQLLRALAGEPRPPLEGS